MARHIGVAISGGGHRATLWGLGTLLYLVDAGVNTQIGCISSVSGGSIANGVIAHEGDYGVAKPHVFDAQVSGLVSSIADTGLFFWGRPTNMYLISLFASGLLGAVAGVVALVLLAVHGFGPASGLSLLVAVVITSWAGWWFEQRSRVVDHALARTYFTLDGRPTPINHLMREVDHVICATELQSADHLYFSPKFVYSYAFGLGVPGDLALATAVQCSACLPGAFAARRFSAEAYRFVPTDRSGRDLVLVDGGVYDNMADQWLVGLADRLRRCPDLPVKNQQIDEIIVVNASSSARWTQHARYRLAPLAELATLLRVNSVMYQITTERRRSQLIADWDAACRAGTGQKGALVHIAQSPYRIASFYQGSRQWPERAARAEAVLAALGDTPAGRNAWQRRAEASSRVPTVLGRLGRDTPIDLLEHSYVLAMCNLHVLLGYPLLGVPSRERFSRLLKPSEG